MSNDPGLVEFPHIFRPMEIGTVTVANRLFVSAHGTGMVEQDPTGYRRWSVLGDRARAYYEERAKGGFGLLVIGQLQVYPNGIERRPGSFHDEAVPAFRSIAAACHRHGTAVFAQLSQNSLERYHSGPDSWEPLWGASPLASGFARARGETAKEMDDGDIAKLVEGFRRSAANCQAGGLDGVEIHAAHPHLLGSWLVPAYNKRTDRYGGSVERRLQLIIDIVEAVRAECGRSYTVGVRINGQWTIPGGQTLEESLVVARMLAGTGMVDFLDVSGWPGIGSIGSPHGPMVPWATAVKDVVPDVPVFAIGRITTPEMAERVLADGRVDMVGMMRASIADPEIPNKARAGRSSDVRICVGAGQGCLAYNQIGQPITCQQNPAVGLEAHWGIGTLTRASRPSRVVVVGGGPAGLEAARTAAERGHRVVLIEQQPELGGQIRLITAVARRAEYAEIVHWRRRRLMAHGADIRLGTEATPELIAGLEPDTVVLATGATPRKVGWYPPMPELDRLPGAELPHVHTVWDVLAGALDGAGHVVLVDGTAFYQSADALEYLATRGVRTTAVSHLPTFAAGIDDNDRPSFMASVRGGDVRVLPSTMATAIEASAVRARDLLHGRDLTIDDVDAVVVSIGCDADQRLVRLMAGVAADIQVVGDCVAPRRIEHAIFEGHRAGRAIG